MEGKQFVENYRISNPQCLEHMIFGGHGQIDLVAPSGKSHCYRFEIPKEPKFPEDVRFVYALHDDRKFYIGMVEHSKFRLTAHSRFDKDTEIVRGAFYIVDLYNKLSDHLITDEKMKLYHNGRCAKCGRKLTDDHQLAIGLGPKCLKKYNEMRSK